MTLEEKKALVADFLARCNRYADGKIAACRAELESASGPRALEIQHQIGDWTAYRTFNEHAIAELTAATLDEWFAESPAGRR